MTRHGQYGQNRYLIDGIIMTVSRRMGNKGKNLYWEGRWKDEQGVWHTRYLGTEHPSRRFPPVPLPPKPAIQWEGYTITLARYRHTRGKPYYRWVGYCRKDGKAVRYYFGSELPGEIQRQLTDS